MPVACPAVPSSNATPVSTSKTPAPSPQHSCITLLLFVLILPMITSGSSDWYRNSSSPLQMLNPWLSACDLVDPSSAPDLQGVCLVTSTTMVPAPAPTTDNNRDSNNNNNNNNNENGNSNNVNNNVHQNCRVNGDISEGPGPPPVCPCDCEDVGSIHSTSTTTPHQNTNQCLDYLNESHKKSVCGSSLTPSERQSALKGLRFEHCCEHTVAASLGAEARDKVIFGNDRQTCETYMDALLELEALAKSITCKFSEVLKRYDCSQPYSVNFQCADCK
ncbi:rho GTPase-activating protein gacF [Zootermopsis nevadensis]|uniref:rho GTPase-activating protein gacF n=1 Tax=Zootermopsis nevadensis TaxID=136037 RepID=UPI000B8E947D|nr:rho GTPase-activating protein gacF [Zootermopsis nevadensis]